MKKNKQKNISNEQESDYISSACFASLSCEERKKWEPVPKRLEKIPIFSIICFIISAICLVIYVVAIFNEGFADFFNFKIGTIFRFILAKITNILPFSLAEFAFILLIPGAIAYIAFAIRKRSDTWKMVISSLSLPVAAVLLVFSLFVVNLGTGYRTPTLDKKLDFPEVTVTKENLKSTALHLIDSVNQLSNEFEYGTDSFSKMPYSFEEMNEKILDAYDKFTQKYDVLTTYDTKLKPVMFSKVMSYMHTLGIYTFFTGEANVNVDFPDYTTPYTSAHELAHQRGIAREDEANMIAFLVCMESDDSYIRYCAYLNMYEYVANALWATDRETYYEVNAKLNYKVKSEQTAYAEFFSQYSDSGISKISSAVNDTFLKVQGTEGEISYNLVVELTVAYYKSMGIIK